VTNPLTRRGVAVVATAAVAWAAALGLGWPAALLPAAAATALLVVAGCALALPSRLSVTRQLGSDRVERGQPALLRVDVRNAGRLPSAPAFLVERVLDRRVRVRLRSVPAGGTRRLHTAVPGLPRGRHTLSGLGTERTDPLELLHRHGSLTPPTTLWVRPVAAPLPPEASQALPRSAETGSGRLLGDDDVMALREYQPGDDPRSVHWRATAHTGHLMVTDRASAARGRTLVVLDPRAPGDDPGDTDAFETAVDLAAGALVEARASGHAVELRVPGLSAAHARREGARDELDHLALVTPSTAPGPATTEVLAGLDGAGTVVVVSASQADDLARTAARRRGGLTVVVLVDAPGRNSLGTSSRGAGSVQLVRVAAPAAV